MSERDGKAYFPEEAATQKGLVQVPVEEDSTEERTHVGSDPPEDCQSEALAEDITVSARNRTSVREVYRLFLDSEHAPALKLADELIAQGDTDPMLVAIARECRTSLEGTRIDGSTTLDEVARLAHMPVSEVIALLERLIAVGAGESRSTE